MTDIIASRSFRGLATPEAIEAVHNELDSIWEDAPFVPSMDQMVFTTAVIETASNVVQHGRPLAGDPVELGVTMTVSPFRLQAKVSAYNAVEPIVPPEDAQMPEDDAAESGRGLALIKALVTTLTFERQDGANTWILAKDSAPEE